MTRKSGFTLIELLVVIAIIGILAAIIFPVYARTKDSAYRSSDTSNMNSLRTALQLYRTDQGAYPPQLLGYVSLYTTGPNTGNIIPANAYVGALFPKRIDSIQTLRPAYVRGNEATFSSTTTAVWPTVDAGDYGGQAPSSCTTSATTAACAQQAFQPSDGTVSISSTGAIGVSGTPANYYTVDGYETAAVKTFNGPIRELHYSLFWTGYGLNSGSASDTTRQLGYSEPPDTTVVTWDSYFRDYDSTNVPVRAGKRDIVLFTGGSARAYDSLDVYNKAWQVTP